MTAHGLIDTTEMYLRTVFELEEEGIVPLRARIAERLSQSGPTVSQTVARMERDGLLHVAGDRQLALTDAGRTLATRVMRKHRLAECLLVSVIQMPWEEVHVEACRWEHVISESVERRLYELLGHPDRCPHGNPIPGLAELVATVPSARREPELADPAGQAEPEIPTAESLATADETMTDVMRDADGAIKVTVTRITEQLQSDMDLMLKLKRAGIQPGREVLLGAVEGGVRVRGEGGAEPATPADLSAEIASHVFVSRELPGELCFDRSVAMTRWNEGSPAMYLPADLVLGQAEIGVIVADTNGDIQFANEHVTRLLRAGDEPAALAGRPLAGSGLVLDQRKAEELARQVLGGMTWEDTLAARRGDGTLVFVREIAVPLRGPSGTIDGIVVLVSKAGRRDAQREPDRIRLLERIGARLAGSLEFDATLRHVAQILVPRFADHCFIDLFSGDKLIRRAAAHAGGWEPPPGTWAKIGEAIQYPPGHFMQQAMTRLETIVVPDLQADFYPAPSEESMSAADQAGLTSVLASPLYARGELLGVISLALSRITDRLDPHYDLSDGDLIGAIAGRVAVAIDNAMLFESERRTALAFQQSLLPQTAPVLDGLEVAFRYIPAKPLAAVGQGIQTQVGGDWYDIIPLAAGRVGLVIGDVEGRGARAAATMGQLRAVLRAYAQDEKSPADIMRKLDEWVRSTAPPGAGGDPPTVSCIYLIYDAWSRELTFANAGHAAPLMAVDGVVRLLEMRRKGVLLGVRGRGISGLPTYRDESITLPPGAAVVLYTDGLTDRRSRSDGDGHYSEAEAVSMLRDALLAAPPSAGALATAAETAVPGDIDDDMAILVFRSSPEDLASVERSFPAEPIMVSDARRLAQATFAAWGMHPDQADLALLLVSEVVTNAVLHASVTPSPSGRRFDLEVEPPPSTAAQPGGIESIGLAGDLPVGTLTPAGGFPVMAHPPRAYRPREFTLRLRRGAESVWVEAFDPDLRLPRLRTARATDEGGRGLYLVEQLATRWGSRPTPEGKAVWFEIPLDAKEN